VNKTWIFQYSAQTKWQHMQCKICDEKYRICNWKGEFCIMALHFLVNQHMSVRHNPLLFLYTMHVLIRCWSCSGASKKSLGHM